MPDTNEYACLKCGANWSRGEWTHGCPECGGGALTIPCPRCGGECGQLWRRAVLDSWDSQTAHWVGRCGPVFKKAQQESMPPES